MAFLDLGAGFGVKPLFKDPQVIASYNKYSDIAMYERQQQFARKKDVVSRWFGEWDEINGTAWQAAILGKTSVADALKRSASAWNDLKKS
jgi:multiple sugar transport system substrate-binding protein